MKKTTFIFMIVSGLFVFNITQASAGCNIVWTGGYGGSKPTNETSRNQIAAEELISVWVPEEVCDSGPPPWCSSSWDSQCFTSRISGALGGCSYTACLDGTWEEYCAYVTGKPPSLVVGTWDVVCHTTTTTTTAPPTIINLSSFTATPKFSKVIIQWSTESETDNTGFNLYRAESEDGESIKINDALISAKGTSTQGSSYEFVDSGLQNRKTYYYKLEDIDLNGQSTMHGPVSATPRWFWGIFGIIGK